MAKRKSKPEFTKEDLGFNTFTSKEKLIIEATKGLASVTDKTGKVHYQEREYEKDKYCRLYNSPENRLSVSKLSSQAKELLMWIMYEVDNGNDYVWLNRQRYMIEAKIKSPTTVSLAVKELLHTFILASKVREVYFINPKYFFFGSRINVFKENVKIVK